MHGIKMFSNLGIAAFIIRDPRGDEPNFINTAWTIQVIRGCGLWLVTCIAAYPMSVVYQEPLLLQMLPLVGLSALISGFNSSSVMSLRRNVDLKPLVIWETASQIFGLLCMIGLAWYLRSVWALAFGAVVRMSVAMMTSQFLIPGRKLKFTWDQAAAHELVRFGKWIFLSTAVTFFINQGDRALLGLFMTKQTLGLFAIATVWSKMSSLALQRLNSHVMLPIYAKLYNRDDVQLRRRVFQARLGLIALFVPLMWALSLGGQWLIDVLYDARYADAGWMLQILAAGAIGKIVSDTAANILLAVGDSRRHMFLQFGRGLILIGCIAIGGMKADIFGMVIGIAVSRIADYPLLVLAIRRYRVWIPSLDLSTFVVSAVVIFAGGVILGQI
jgi:O-antigen/teichoic acid export membrane protein